MVKIIIIALLSLGTYSYSFCNPVMVPPLIIEIYFGPEGWQIEIMGNEYCPANNLDNISLCGIYDTAQFVNGIELMPGEILTVTQADLMTEMDIHQEGDWLTLYYIDNNAFYPVDELGLFWGNTPVTPVYYYLNCVTAPAGEQSIAVQEIWNYGDFWVVKEEPNTIGFSPFEVSKRADFSGVVRDLNDEPMADVEVICDYGDYQPYIITGSDGHFSVINSMFCRIYDVSFKYDGGIIGDSTISIEPDASNYFEFKLDTLLTGIHEIKPATSYYSIFNIPNPSLSQTTFIIETNLHNPDQKGIIKIYTENGYIVDILPVMINNEKEELVYNFKEKSLSSGLYFYNLEIKNQKVASGQMIIR